MAKKKIEPVEIELEIDLDGDEIDDLEELELDEPLIEDDEDALLDDDEDDDDSMGATIVRKPGDDDDEEDLSKILKDRLASEDLPAEEDEVPDNEERSTGDDELQPKRADELLCNSCFLLVRKNAPMCPIGDDACPVFVK